MVLNTDDLDAAVSNYASDTIDIRASRRCGDRLGHPLVSMQRGVWREGSTRSTGMDAGVGTKMEASALPCSPHATQSVGGRTAVFPSDLVAEPNDDGVPRASATDRPGLYAGGGNVSSNTALLALVRLRKLRAALFSEKLFAQPAWDMLLELLECQLRARRISVSGLYLAAGVPPATALRRINDMEAAGLIRRVYDPCDRRRQFVELTPRTRDKLTLFFQDAQVRDALLIDERNLTR
jgi:DNA-binding MarR family transcriptional regulator